MRHSPTSTAQCAALALLLAGLAQPATALTVAFDVPSGTVGNQSFGGVLAMDFEVLSPVTVLELGAFDSGSDGISGTVTVELWSRNGSTGVNRLAALDFARAADVLRGGHRFRTIDPLPLGTGQYSIVAYGFDDTDRNGNADGFGAFPGDFPWTLSDGGGALLFTASRFSGTPGSSIGTIPDSTQPPNKYAAGSFSFELGTDETPTPIPLPPTALMLLAGLWAMRIVHAKACVDPRPLHLPRCKQPRSKSYDPNCSGPTLRTLVGFS